MASVIDICNLGLLRVGQTLTIQSLTEGSEAARVCSVVYPLARDELLEEFPWPFACRRAALALVDEDPSDDWAYSYRLPDGCLRALRILGLGRDPVARIPFEVEGDDAGRLLYTNEADAVLHYLVRIEDAGLFPAAFVDALAWRLARELAMPMGRKDGAAAQAETGYQRALAKAREVALADQEPAPAPESSLLTARY